MVTISWWGDPAARSNGGSPARKRWTSRAGVQFEHVVQLVVQGPGALHHRDVLRDLRQRGVTRREVESFGQARRELGNVRAEHRDRAPGEDGCDHLIEAVARRLPSRSVTRGKRRILAQDGRVESLEPGGRLDSELVHKFMPCVEIGL